MRKLIVLQKTLDWKKLKKLVSYQVKEGKLFNIHIEDSTIINCKGKIFKGKATKDGFLKYSHFLDFEIGDDIIIYRNTFDFKKRKRKSN